MLSDSIANLLRTISQPTRVEILLAIGGGEACVCHLEAVLGLRQAYISQQLMALREAEIVTTRRDGRNIFYQLRDPSILELIQQAARLSGSNESDLSFTGATGFQPGCPCPKCSAEAPFSMDSASPSTPQPEQASLDE
ncbi:MAG: helix-turn-helix transcriptional regulator [Chloroflexota bacterium]|nr:MAG: helix-turn-helix transcriptional regulator [Chloroflexota bacterium]